jgi:hypothetical protein
MELSHSFNIVLNPEVSDKIRGVQNQLKTQMPELRKYDSSPHLAIATRFTDDRLEVAKLPDLLRAEFQNDRVWELEFQNFSTSSEGNYIFLNLTENSKNKIYQLRERAYAATKGIGHETPDNLPPKFAFDPHISIIKSDPEKIAAALPKLNHDFTGIKMLVNKYELTSETPNPDGFSNFPVICQIILNS